VKPKRLRWAGHEARTGEARNSYKILERISLGNRLLRKPRRRWEDTINENLRKI